MKLLRFKTFDFEAFKKEYGARCEEKRDTRQVWEKNQEWNTVADFVTLGMAAQEEMDGLRIMDESEAPVIRRPLRRTNDARLMEKTYYLMDEVIYRSVRYTNGNPEIPKKAIMNASVMKSVIGRDYKPILEAFVALKYLEGNGAYTHKAAKKYEVIDEIEEIDCPKEIERKVQEYQKKTAEILTTARNEQQEATLLAMMRRDNPEATEEDASSFLDYYTKSLNKIKIADEEGLNKALEARRKKARTELNKKGELKDPKQIDIYYDMLQREVRGPKNIYKIDAQGRMYHYLTALKKELKEYLTFSFAVDCKNSHPVLFNYMIFRTAWVRTETALEVSRLTHDLYDLGEVEERTYHYAGKYIRNYLIDNGIYSLWIAGLKPDELIYIYETTNGIFWDNICQDHPELNRDEIKAKMFEEVFYSKTPNTSFKTFGKIFKARYPNVYKTICRWKYPEKYPSIQKYLDDNGIVLEKSTAALPVALMALESRIFTSALASLYRKRYQAVHIHDCIVIPAGRKHQPTPEEVKKILLKEYKKYGLVPTWKAE